ncbi:carbon storage regulator [Roseiconus lacunae]|uniref:carbon storage regulator n=1 Tax=Roseiconus lacunae TaxID=2605694 RepID=UPI001E3B0BD6|nr:carbon storage regulator [Roseiconus lacunae]MCD0463562.1 carbon storage regulator [Roseiconus lacunae]
MLVLSRRENQKVYFPQIGISICITRTQRGKTTLGINAPKHIDVIRQELLSDYQPSDRPRHLNANDRETLPADVEEQIQLATDRITLARQELQEGNEHDALALIGQAIAELDHLRLQNSADDPTPRVDSDQASSSDPSTWDNRQAVGETATVYQNSACSHRRCSDSIDEVRRVIIVKQDDDLASSLSAPQRDGVEFSQVDDGFHAFLELSRARKADAIVFDRVPVSAADIDIIRHCSQQPEIPIVVIETGRTSPSVRQVLAKTCSTDERTIVITSDRRDSIHYEFDAMLEAQLSRS